MRFRDLYTGYVANRGGWALGLVLTVLLTASCNPKMAHEGGISTLFSRNSDSSTGLSLILVGPSVPAVNSSGQVTFTATYNGAALVTLVKNDVILTKTGT